MRLWNRRWIGLALLAGLLAGCGDDAASNTPVEISPLGVSALEGEGPPCQWNYDMPYFHFPTTCAEVVYDRVAPVEAAPELTGLAFAPDGTLYMARTAAGEIWALRDDDGDRFMDEPVLVAEGLRLPTRLTVHAGALYVASVGGVLRLDDADGDGTFETHTVLVADVGEETGFWPGSVGIGPDERLYVSLGANCYACEGVDVEPGRLVSYALDGSDERLEADGLRYPADFDWHPITGELWVVDSARVLPRAGEIGAPDELNRVTPGADFGFPACVGSHQPDSLLAAPETDCAATVAPAVAFPHQSTPAGMTFYPGDTFPFWQNSLLLALSGSSSLAEPTGYALAAVVFDGGEPTGQVLRVVPTTVNPPPVNSLAEYLLSGRGFFPAHPVDIAISPEGWVYVAIQEGQIFRYRPRPAADS